MAIARDSSAGGGATAGTAFSYTHTVGSGLNNSIAIVFTCIPGGAGTRSVSDVTWGGESIVGNVLKNSGNINNNVVGAYYKVNPPAGATTVAMIISGTATDICCESVVYYGVGNSQPDASTSGTGYPFTLTPNVDKTWMIAAYSDVTTSGTPSVASGGTAVRSQVTGNATIIVADTNAQISPPTSTTITFSNTVQSNACGIAFTLAPLGNILSFRTLLGVGE